MKPLKLIETVIQTYRMILEQHRMMQRSCHIKYTCGALPVSIFLYDISILSEGKFLSFGKYVNFPTEKPHFITEQQDVSTFAEI